MPTQVPSSVFRESNFFDELAIAKGDFNPFAERGWRTLGKCFSNVVQGGEPLDILDVGCGTGQSRQIYSPYIKSYVGADVSPRSIEIARRKHPLCKWVVADACALPFENESFDVIAYSSVLHHIPDFIAALREGIRVLRPGGLAFAFDPNLLHPAMAALRHPRSPFYLSAGVSPNERPLLPGSLSNAFAKVGFLSISQVCKSNIAYRAVAPRGLNTFLTLYNVFDSLWERSGLATWFGTFVVTCGRKQNCN